MFGEFEGMASNRDYETCRYCTANEIFFYVLLLEYVIDFRFD